MKKIICSTEMDDSSKKYRKKGKFWYKVGRPCNCLHHLSFHISRVHNTVPPSPFFSLLPFFINFQLYRNF